VTGPAAAPGRTSIFDVVVLGSGVAGLVAALDLLDARGDLRVAVVDKGALGTIGSTPLAQGGLAAAVGPDDSPELHAADTLRAGDGLGDRQAVRVMSEQGPARVADLVRRGAAFDRRDAPGAPFALAREGGQSVARSVRAVDATGAEIFRALSAAAAGRITRVQGMGCAFVQPMPGGPVRGLWILLDDVDDAPGAPAQSAGLACLRAGAVVLASGGCGGLYAATTNREGSTADGVALAAAAGGALIDCEFVQFHPTGLRVERAAGAQRLLLTEALRGAGAVLRDADGRRFMVGRHPDAELAPRFVVTRGILDQPGGAWLDATALDPALLAAEFPTVLAGARETGYDLTRQPVPVEPTQHYFVGGVATDLDGRTTLPGLFAAGEAACTGVHGANRMAGNSLLQSAVFAHRAALALATDLPAPEHGRRELAAEADPSPPPLSPAGSVTGAAALRAELRAAMSAGAGAIRTADGLDGVAKAIDTVAHALGPLPAADRDGLELASLVRVGRLIVRSATLRQESRGVHWRADAPLREPAWDGVRLRVGEAAHVPRPTGGVW